MFSLQMLRYLNQKYFFCLWYFILNSFFFMGLVVYFVQLSAQFNKILSAEEMNNLHLMYFGGRQH